jgi:probable HAF family extracellular repeat protein
MQDLGTLPGGLYSEGYGINNMGQVVGSSGIPVIQGTHAFIFDAGLMKDLNTMVDPAGSSKEWNLFSAYSINDVGQIAGWGTFNGNNHGFLLIPESTSNPAALPSPAWAALSIMAALAIPQLLRKKPRSA